MNMFVKLLKDWDGNDAGTVLEVAEEDGKNMVKFGVAEVHDPEAEEKALEEDAKLQTLVEASVKSALKDVKAPGINLHVDVNEPEPKTFSSLGEQMKAIADSKTKGKSAKLNEYLSKAPTGASEIVDADGGYLVQHDFQDELFQIMTEGSILAAKANTTPVSGNGLKWNEVDKYNRTEGNRAVTVYRTAEGATKTTTKAQFLPRKLELAKLTGVYPATDELLEDVPALGAEIRGWFGEEFGFAIDNEIVNGTGVGQMLGILNAPCLVTQAKSAARSADALSVDLPAMLARLHSSALEKAEWYINQAIMPYLIGLTVGETPVFTPPNGFVDAPAGMLFGKRINWIEQASAVGTVGDIILADMSKYKVITKSGGVKSDVSIHAKFLEDETLFRFVVRNNGAPLWSKVVTPADGSGTTQSAFVTLGA